MNKLLWIKTNKDNSELLIKYIKSSLINKKLIVLEPRQNILINKIQWNVYCQNNIN